MNESVIKWNFWLLCASFFFAFYQGTPVGAIHCEIVNKTYPHGNIFVDCGSNHAYCFAAWYNNSNSTTGQKVEHKGCWRNNSVGLKPTEDCKGITQTSHNSKLILCYCTKNLCNMNLTWVGYEEEHTNPTVGTTTPMTVQNNHTILYVILPITAIILLLFIVFMIYMRKCGNLKTRQEDVSKGSEVETLIPATELPPIDLKDVLSQGQFCIVRKGRMGYRDVAVKIFLTTQFSKPTPSALTEKDIYSTCKLNHENILKFIGEHVHEEGSQQQLWLVTEYIDQGSLSDFLKRNTITLENVMYMAQGMALGMAYLHQEIPGVKPSIAHRDIKSKNILVKNNLTCCISDFGLSLKFDGNDAGDTHGQVGTRRYMAPEVLEGAINFSREAFLRIDMYAFALCLWELLTRCKDVQEEPVSDYKLPFEDEVGIHPSLEELQDYVVNKKLRPNFPGEWRNKDQTIDDIIVTIEECWDHDADARLTADCVAERVKSLCTSAKRNASLAVSFKSLEQENALLA